MCGLIYSKIVGDDDSSGFKKFEIINHTVQAFLWKKLNAGTTSCGIIAINYENYQKRLEEIT